MDEIMDIAVNKILDPKLLLHPNPDINYLKELANSIKNTGQQQEIVVKKEGSNFRLIIGYCRTKAAQTFGIPSLRARVTEMDDKNALLSSATENIHRLEQDPIKEAECFTQLAKDHNMTTPQIAEKFGKSEAYVKFRLVLLELPKSVQQMVQNKEITMGVASAVSRIPLEAEKVMVAADFRDKPLTVEQAKSIVTDFLDYKVQMIDAKPAEVLEKAREEYRIQCFFCSHRTPIEKIMTVSMCKECHRGAQYLFEKERREDSAKHGAGHEGE